MHKMRDLATSLKSFQIGTCTQNDLQLALNNSKILEILGNTLNICFIDDDHKQLLVSKEIDFKIEAETLDTWISFNTYPLRNEL